MDGHLVNSAKGCTFFSKKNIKVKEFAENANAEASLS